MVHGGGRVLLRPLHACAHRAAGDCRQRSPWRCEPCPVLLLLLLAGRAGCARLASLLLWRSLLLAVAAVWGLLLLLFAVVQQQLMMGLQVRLLLGGRAADRLRQDHLLGLGHLLVGLDVPEGLIEQGGLHLGKH